MALATFAAQSFAADTFANDTFGGGILQGQTMALTLGLEGKLYYDESGVGGSTWKEIANVKDVTLTLNKAEADVSTRAGGGWRLTATTLKEAEITFEMPYDRANAAFLALRDAWLAGTTIGIAVMDGDIATSGNQGLQVDCEVINFGRTEELEDSMRVPITLKPTTSTTAPAWVTIV